MYHPESIYNVNGVRMTLEEYQTAMNMSFKQMDIEMGNVTNMILVEKLCTEEYCTRCINMINFECLFGI